MTDGQATAAKLLALSEPDPFGACWIWQGAQNSKGYGYARVCAGELPEHPRIARVHRLSYWLFRGPFDLDLTIDHICHVRTCLNPWHLHAETLEYNSFDGAMTKHYGPEWLDEYVEGF